MSDLDLDALLVRISAEEPCGPDLEYDPQFGELERAAESRDEQQIGDTVVEAEEPDWGAVQSLAVELLWRTKDLRVAMHLTRALLNVEGFPGLRDGLAITRGLVENYWPTVHPQLDPDDDYDSTMRINILLGLCDEAGTLSKVRSAALVSSRAIGRFGLRDLAYAQGEVSWPESADGSPPDMATIDAAFTDADLEELQVTADALRACIEHLDVIESTLNEQIGIDQAPSLSPLRDVLGEAAPVLADRLARRGVGEAAAAGAAGEEAAGTVAGPRIAGQVQSRDDVLRTLDLVIGYYRSQEPSSPVPMLLMRAKRLVHLSFLEIVRDLAPDGVLQVETIAGASEDGASADS